MEFRPGTTADAEAIAGLIASFQSELTDDPSGAGAEQFLASVSLQAERDYLASERYRYLLAYSDSRLAGFVAIREDSHLFHLFVDRSHQGQGVARRLWERALQELCAPGSDGGFTVNSSLSAVPDTKPSALFRQDQYRGSMASRFFPCGVRHASVWPNQDDGANSGPPCAPLLR